MASNDMLFEKLMEQESVIVTRLKEFPMEKSMFEDAKETCFIEILKAWEKQGNTQVSTSLLTSIISRVVAQSELQCFSA